MHRTQGRDRMSQAAERIRQAATRKPKEKLTALLHHITTDALEASYFMLKKDAAAGVDGVTWEEYGNGLEERLLDLHDRVHSGAYRALPSRRVEIPKPDGGTRPLGIAALEDKIVQTAVAETILVPIFEPEFLGFSYGFRPGRGAHDALDALAYGIERRKVNWIVDADIRAFLESSSYCPLVHSSCSVSVRRRRDVVVCCLLIEDSFPVFSERAEPDVFPGLCEFILSVVFAPPLCCSDMDPSGRLVGDP